MRSINPKVIPLLMFCAVLSISGTVNGKTTQRSARKILTNASARYDSIRDYKVNAKLSIESPEMHIPRMDLKISFKSPDKVHVDSSNGFAMVPKRGVVFGNPIKSLLTGTDLTLLRSDVLCGAECYVIRSSSRKKGEKAESTVWIDKKNSLVRQVSAKSESGPEVRINLEYKKIDGKYWMPSRTSAKILLPRVAGEKPREKSAQPSTIIINFAGYQINTGISDKMFKPNGG